MFSLSFKLKNTHTHTQNWEIGRLSKQRYKMKMNFYELKLQTHIIRCLIICERKFPNCLWQWGQFTDTFPYLLPVEYKLLDYSECYRHSRYNFKMQNMRILRKTLHLFKLFLYSIKVTHKWTGIETVKSKRNLRT